MTDVVFCDDLRVTVPVGSWDDVRSQVDPVLEDFGAEVESHCRDKTVWRVEGGTMHAKRCGIVWSLSASGQMLAGLRLRKLLGHFLAAIASGPHRVTGLHATLDRKCATPPEIQRLLDAVESDEGLKMSRKRVAIGQVQRQLTRQADGSDTGTIYLGSKHAEVRAAVYDKRAERIDRGFPDLGHDLTRYELRLRSGVGATLRDAAEPSSIFWHYIAPDVLPLPDGVLAWESRALGVELDRPAPLPPFERLRSRVYRSDDLAAILQLAESCGPRGFATLVGLLRSRMAPSAGGVQGLTPAEAALSPPEAA